MHEQVVAPRMREWNAGLGHYSIYIVFINAMACWSLCVSGWFCIFGRCKVLQLHSPLPAPQRVPAVANCREVDATVTSKYRQPLAPMQPACTQTYHRAQVDYAPRQSGRPVFAFHSATYSHSFTNSDSAWFSPFSHHDNHHHCTTYVYTATEYSSISSETKGLLLYR